MAMFSYKCVLGWIRPSVAMSLYKDILVDFLQGWNHGGVQGQALKAQGQPHRGSRDQEAEPW